MKKKLELFTVLVIVLFSIGVANAVIYVPLTIPMRDGVNLATDFYLPNGWNWDRWPVLLIRTPYNKLNLAAIGLWADEYNIIVAIQDMRGRFASEGEDTIFQSDGWGELQDGLDTVNWIHTFFSNGNIVTWGASALGIVQYLLAGAAPWGIGGQVVFAASPDLYEHAFYPGGVFRKKDIEDWLSAQGSLFKLPELRAHRTKDEYWEGVNLDNRVEVLGPPAYHIGGWFDLFSQGTIDAYMLYKEGGAPHQYLVMGPWSHGTPYTNVQNELTFPTNAKQYWGPFQEDPSITFLKRALKGQLGIFDRPSVTYYVMCDVDAYPNAPGCEWRTADNWPPAETKEVKLYLMPDKTLYVDEPSEFEFTYVYDPNDPTPTVCGLFLTLPTAPCDLSDDYDTRSDVLYFETPVLPQPVEVTGRVYLDLKVKSDREDTDFVAFLVDVYPDGRKMLFLHGIMRARFREGFDKEVPLIPNQPAQLTIDLWSTSLVFNTGHKIGLYIASANYPGFDKNLNNGINASPFDPPLVATNTVITGANSVLRLPVVGDFPWHPTGDDDEADDDANDDDTPDNDSGGDLSNDTDGGCGC